MTVERGGSARPEGAGPDATNQAGPDGAGTDTLAQPSAGHRFRGILLYGGVATAGLVVLQLVLGAGRRLPAPRPAGGAGGPKLAVDTGSVVWKLLLAAVLVIVVARVAGALFQRINQPQVVGEIVAGIVLGPSVLGAVLPRFSHFVFTDQMLPFLDVLAQVGLIFFMFLVGLELDVRLIKGRGHTAATVSGVSIIAPFLLGAVSALVLFPTLGSASGRFTPFALFLGASMSITAFPVLARILTERNLYKTPLGAVTLTCAAVDDMSAWCMLAVVVAIARAHGSGRALLTIALSAIFVVAMIHVVRPQLARMARYHEQQGQLPSAVLALLFVAILLSALATDRIGIHAIFGAFLLGAVMPARSELVGELVAKLEDFTVVFLLPLFFAFTGLRTNLGLLGGELRLWGVCGLILLVAVAGKWGGSTVAARVMGMGWRESMALGVLMNTRGLTELIILNIGLDLKVIPPALFTMLVLMALVTTFMTTPLLSLFYRGPALEQITAESDKGAEAEGGQAKRPLRVLVPVAKPGAAHELVHTALRLARDADERVQIILLRVVQLPGSAYRAGPGTRDSMVARAAQALRPLAQMVEGAGYDVVPVTVASGDAAQAIVREVEERKPDLVLMAWHRSLWGHRLLFGLVGEVLRRAPADVAVVVDPAGRGIALRRDGRIVVPYGGGFHEDVGIELALRLARSSRATVTLLGPAGEDGTGELSARAARAYEETGVWTTPLPVEGDVGTALVDQAGQADLVVLGVGEQWARDKRSLGGLRGAVAARATAPVIIVRRHGQRAGLRRPRDWIVQSGEAGALERAGQVAEHLG